MSSGLKLKYEYVKQFIEDKGCQLLQDNYENVNTKMKIQCSCKDKTVFNVTFGHFKRGDRCGCNKFTTDGVHFNFKGNHIYKCKDGIVILISSNDPSKHIIIDEYNLGRLSQHTWYTYNNEEKNTDYAWTTIHKRTITLHQLLMNPQKGEVTDHIDHNGLNCSTSNMRNCSYTQNSRNSISHRNSTSRFKGVYWNKQINKWVSRISTNTLGCYCNEEFGAFVYNSLASIYDKDYYYLNDLSAFDFTDPKYDSDKLRWEQRQKKIEPVLMSLIVDIVFEEET